MEVVPVDQVNKYSQLAWDYLIEFGPNLLGGILFLFIGLWIVKKIANGFNTLMEKREMDPSLRPFLRTLILTVLRILVVVSVMGMVGIEMTSFIALLGAAGLAVGMALSGTLQNFAGGVMILIFKPYKVGDVIEASGYIGSVSEIQIFNTIMKTWDNKTIIIPNAQLSNNSLTNYSTEGTRKVEWVFGIGYGDDIDKAKSIIEKIVFTDERVTDEPGSYFINVSELGDSSVNIKVRAIVSSENYWQLFFDVNERIKKAFDKEGISIPFPQRDVHLYQQK